MLACLCQERSCGNSPRFWALEISRTVETAFIYMGLIQYDHQEWCHSSFNWRSVKQTTGSATVTSSIGASGQSCFLAVWKQLCQRNQHCPVLQFLFRTLFCHHHEEKHCLYHLADTKAKSAAASWELSDKQANFSARTGDYTLRSKKLSSSVKKRQGRKKPQTFTIECNIWAAITL